MPQTSIMADEELERIAASRPTLDEDENTHKKTIQLPAYEGIYFKFSAKPDMELPWFKNLTVTAYQGTPPPDTEKKAKRAKGKPKGLFGMLMPGLTTYSIRRGGMQGAFDGANDDDEHEPSHRAATVEDEEVSFEKSTDGPSAGVSVRKEDDQDTSAKKQKLGKKCDDDEIDNSEVEDEDEEDNSGGEEDDSEDEEGYDEYDECDEEDSESEEKTGSKRIGGVFARLMRRGEIRSDFWRDMEEPSQDTAALAFDIFDRYGCLREEFITGSKKGSEVWSHEVDTGNLLQIETVDVNLPSRRQGIATTMLRIILDEAEKIDKWFRFGFAWPTVLNHTLDDKLPKEEYSRLRKEAEASVITLFVKAGFRRVGTSVWFAYAIKPDHPSHKLAATANVPPAEQKSELQKLEDSLESARTLRQWQMSTVMVSDRFKGYSDEDVERLLFLRAVISPSVATIAQTKYGCTCGECLDGYLSPRMATQIQHSAEWNYDMGDEMTWDLIPDDDDFMAPSSWRYLPQEVKPYMKSNKSNQRGLRNIFKHIVDTLARKSPPTIPAILSTASASSEWPPHTRNFLDRAGRPGIEAVLRGLFDEIKGKDPKFAGLIDVIAQRKEFSFVPPDPAYVGFPDIMLEEAQFELEALADLPTCRNDGEFGFVLGMLLNKVVGASMEEYWGGPGVE